MPRIERVETLDDREYKGGAEDGREVEATEVIEFSWGGKNYRTYLSRDNAQAFMDDLAPWVEFAEQVEEDPVRTVRKTPARRSSSTGPRRDRTESTEIREWAQSQNFNPPVSDRGRIPDNVIEAFYAAHPEKTRPANSAA
jgi:hypothetical protein